MFIALSGLIGVGKTTLAHSLSTTLNIPEFKEPVEGNPFLNDFYDPIKRKGVAFAMEIYLFTQRFAVQRAIVYSPEGGVQDRSLYEDLCFVEVLHDEGTLTDAEYRTYQEMFTTFLKGLPHPDLIVHLDCTPEVALDRIHLRGRACEEGIPLAYLVKLHAAYEKVIARVGKDVPILRIPCNEDFAHPDEVLVKVKHAIETRTRIQTL